MFWKDLWLSVFTNDLKCSGLHHTPSKFPCETRQRHINSGSAAIALLEAERAENVPDIKKQDLRYNTYTTALRYIKGRNGVYILFISTYFILTASLSFNHYDQKNAYCGG